MSSDILAPFKDLRSFTALLVVYALAGTCELRAANEEPVTALPSNSAPQSALKASHSGYVLYFSEEFEPTTSGAPNPKHWDYDVSYVRNKELQCYTDNRRENVRIENRTIDGETNGYLVLELRKEPWNCPQDDNKPYSYTSGAVMSRERKNGRYLIGDDSESGLPFGIYEIRAKIPSGRGTWPAIWLLGHKAGPNGLGWPNAGEIDIMEAVGFEEDQGRYRLHSHLHRSRDYAWPNGRGKTGQGLLLVLDTPPSSQFRTWTMIWESDSIEIFVDGRRVTQMEVMQQDDAWAFENRHGFIRSDPGMNAEESLAWPFSKELGNEFKLVLNLAYGGNWGGQRGVDDSIFDAGPVELLVDYVRIYTKKLEPVPGVPQNVRFKSEDTAE